MSDSDALAAFRRQIQSLIQQSGHRWEDSRKVHDASAFPTIHDQLIRAMDRASLDPSVTALLRQTLQQRPVAGVHALDGSGLKTLTGLPPSKAFRALCLYFDLIPDRSSRWPLPTCETAVLDHCAGPGGNPFDLLRAASIPSLLDLGAGDCSFVSEVADRYLPLLTHPPREFIVHAIDRLDPRSKLGGPLHPSRDRIMALQQRTGLDFHLYANADMCDLHELDEAGKLARLYTLVTCWAPATPTFAYEPTRLSEAIIREDLHRTKGAFRKIRFEGEPALEVQHGDRALIFPAWKFEIRGPLALLHLIARRALVGVLGSVDAQVFWELLAQLVEDPRYRPTEVAFTPQNLPDIFGDLYRELSQLPIGSSIALAELTALRTALPSPANPPNPSAPVSFRHVTIRRGAVFPDIPASSTARQFSQMKEEVPPWFLTLIPTRSS